MIRATGLNVSGHIPMALTVQQALDAGISSIEHIDYAFQGRCEGRGGEHNKGGGRSLWSQHFRLYRAADVAGLYLLRIPTLARKTCLFLEWNWAMFFPPDIPHLGYRRTQRRGAGSLATPKTRAS